MMKYSIRTHLTFLSVTVFLCIFLFLFISAGIALYLSLNHAVDKSLELEEQRIEELLTVEFGQLLTIQADYRKSIDEAFLEELDELYNYKHQFVMVSIETNNGRHVFTGGERENVQTLLTGGFLSYTDGFYNHEFDGNLYRILIRNKDWGRLILGAENQTFYEVASEFRMILLIGIPLLLFIVITGGNFLARRAMRPVVSAAEKARNMTLSNLEENLSDYDKNDEFGILVDTLNDLITRLGQGVRRIRRFTQDAAHELRTPITILRGELELLYQQQGRIIENDAALQKALDKTILLNRIVDDLMLLAQSDSGNYQLNSTTFQLDQILRDTVEDIEILSEKSQVKIQLNHCDPIQFSGDEALIRRLLLNLSDNALKYTEKGQITLSLSHQPDAVKIQICDTGIGIPESALPHIFDRFHRVSNAGSGIEKGSGLGMSISKWIVEAHGGQIQIESKLSKGTKITILFPTK